MSPIRRGVQPQAKPHSEELEPHRFLLQDRLPKRWEGQLDSHQFRPPSDVSYPGAPSNGRSLPVSSIEAMRSATASFLKIPARGSKLRRSRLRRTYRKSPQKSHRRGVVSVRDRDGLTMPGRVWPW